MINTDCDPGYSCFQNANGLNFYRAEATLETVMGYMRVSRFDIASLARLESLLGTYAP